jgi:hypothetical protein
MGWSWDRFWGSTLTEFHLAVEAFEEDRVSDLKRLAWHAANIMNMLRGKKSRAIKVKDLVREPSAPAPTFANREEFLEYMRAKERRRRLRAHTEGATVH